MITAIPTMYLDNSPAEVIAWLLTQLDLVDKNNNPLPPPATDPRSWSIFAPSIPLTPRQAWPAFATNEPNEPDDCITVTDTVGLEDGREMVGGDVLYHYGFQVRVRALDHPTGFQKTQLIRMGFANLVYGMLVTVPNPATQPGYRAQTWSNATYEVFAISGIGPVIPIGKDKPTSMRSLFTLNAMCTIRQVA